MILSACVPTGQNPDQVTRWGRSDETLVATEAATPDTKVTVSPEAPSNTGHAIERFWDEENLWNVRLMPDEAGSGSYRTSSEPPVPGLDGRVGSFEVSVAKNPTAPPLKHGAVRVSSNGSQLSHADATPSL